MDGLRILVAVKQVSRAESADFDANGQMVRRPQDQELNPFCRRAVTFGVALARQHRGTCDVVSMGPPTARQILKEALAIGADEAFHLTDSAFAGADTLATAEVLARFVKTHPSAYDLILTGRFAVDANTGIVGAQLAELLDIPYSGAARELALKDHIATLDTELDDGTRSASVTLPAVISVAERICAPAKPTDEEIEAIPAQRISTLGRFELGFVEAVPSARTVVDGISHDETHRLNIVIDGRSELDKGLAMIRNRPLQPLDVVTQSELLGLDRVAYLCDPGQPKLNRHLINYLGAGIDPINGQLTVLSFHNALEGGEDFGGVDYLVEIDGAPVEDDLVPAIANWLLAHPQQLLVTPATSFGREVGGRLGARLNAGVLTDLSRLSSDRSPLVSGAKSVGSIASAANVSAVTSLGIALLRPDMPQHLPSRRLATPTKSTLVVQRRGRVTLSANQILDILDFANAPIIFGVGAGVSAEDLPLIEELAASVQAQLGCTRKIADRGIMPRSRQIGITGRSVSPGLYIAIGTRGSHNHLAGVRGALMTVNLTTTPPDVDPGVDLTVLGDWHLTLPPIVNHLREQIRPW